jgi:hypothetical protein
MGKRVLNCLADTVVNLQWVMFHPACLRENLLVFQSVTGNFSPGMILKL